MAKKPAILILVELPAAELVARFQREYAEAKAAICGR